LTRDILSEVAMAKSLKILGDCFGVRFVPRGRDDDHVCLQILIEDDTYWHKHGSSFSSHHIDDLISVLQMARAKLETMPKEGHGFGWKFPETPGPAS
jgi:hypothetical protein